MLLLCATATNANTTEVHTLCKAAKRTDQRGHTFSTGPELRQRSIRQTVANVRRRKLQVFTNPGEWKGSSSLLYDPTSPISDGIQFTPPERGSLFKPPPPPCGAANTHNYTKNKASCCRLPRQSFKQRFLADSRFPLQLSVEFSILTSCRLLVFGLLLLQFGGWCRFRGRGTGSVRGERLRLKTKRIQPLSRCIQAALVSLNRCLSLCLCRLLLQTDNSSTASRLTLRLRALSVLPAPHAEHRHERCKAFWDFEFYSNKNVFKKRKTRFFEKKNVRRFSKEKT